MRSFLELLPFRIEQAIPGRWLRATCTRRKRKHPAIPVSNTDGLRRLFIDMAVISDHDSGTGIQRVVRELAIALQAQASTQWDVHFVSAKRGTPYSCIAWPDRTQPVTKEIMRARPGDIFLGLDYSLDAVRRHRHQLARFRRDGGALWFLVHDLLPLNHPEWFSRNTIIRYKAWFGIMAGIADGFFCNSQQTETELREALAKGYGLTDGYSTQVLPMGHAIAVGQQDAPLPPRFDLSDAFALMVGTLEPRKGHADIIAAFDSLWKKGNTTRLVLVGRLGWQVQTLRNLILSHPQYGTKLLWFDDVQDAELSQIYESCTGVIIASLGEGFGLPLIEALGHGKPVLARDLPIFRVHEGKGVRFFPKDAHPADLEKAVERWFNQAKQGKISVTQPTEDWHDSVSLLLLTIKKRFDLC